MIHIRAYVTQVEQALRRAIQSTGRPESILRAAGDVIYSLTIGAWDTSIGQRPAAWPPRRDGTPATLYRTGALRHSIRLAVTSRSAWITTDRRYAAIHQFGGATRAHVITPRRARVLRWMAGGTARFARRVRHPGSRIPARPYFPLTPDGRLTPYAMDLVLEAIRDATRI